MKAFEEFLGCGAGSRFGIVEQYNLFSVELPCPEHPHEGLCLGSSLGFFEHLYRRFISHRITPGNELPPKVVAYWSEELFGIVYDPVGDGTPAYIEVIQCLEISFLSV